MYEVTKKAIIKKSNADNATKLVRGHLINDELYGTGVETYNLAPIPKQANSDMLNGFETKAKELVHSNVVISLNVIMTYGKPNDTKLGGKSYLEKEIGTDPKLPVKIKYTLQEKVYKGKITDKQVDINNPSKWKNGSFSKKDTIDIKHDDFF